VRTLGIAARRVKWEQKMYWRNPAAAGFTFAFPLLFLVVFATINGNNHVRIAGGVVRFAQYYVPGIVAFGVISACYTNLAIALTFRREAGILKRTRGTPVSPTAYLAGMVGNVIVIALLLSAVTVAFGVVVYGVTFPGRYLGLALTIVLAAFCFSALGIAMSTFAPNEDAAPALVNFVIFPLLFISGTFQPIRAASAIGRIARVFPVWHLNRMMVSVFSPFGGGSGIEPRHALALLAWGAGATVVAARRFRWERRRGAG